MINTVTVVHQQVSVLMDGESLTFDQAGYIDCQIQTFNVPLGWIAKTVVIAWLSSGAKIIICPILWFMIKYLQN